MRCKLKKYIIIYYMCVICGYEIAGEFAKQTAVTTKVGIKTHIHRSVWQVSLLLITFIVLCTSL